MMMMMMMMSPVGVGPERTNSHQSAQQGDGWWMDRNNTLV